MAEGFWGGDWQRAFFDVRVFNRFAQSYGNITLPQNELEKRRAYDERAREIEHASFSPLDFSKSGGMGTTAMVVYKRLASMLTDKHNQPYSKMVHWLHCRLSFSLLRSSMRCLRGSRSSIHHPTGPPSSSLNIDLACGEGRVPH